MIVLNEVFRDGRVLRAAQALKDRYDLTLLGVDRGKLPFDPDEQRRRLGLKIEWAKIPLSGNLPRNACGYFARYAEAWARVVHRCVRLRPDVVHAHDLSALPVAMTVQAVIRCKVVYDAHELYRDVDRAGRFLWFRPAYPFETWAMNHCAGIIACNRWRAKIMRDEYGAPFLPTVVRNVPQFQPYRPSDLLRQFVRQRNGSLRRVVLHQGGISPGRGMENVVRAVPLLPPDVAVVLMGFGGQSYLEQLAELAEQVGARDRLFFHPPVDHAELPRYTPSADVGIVIYQNTSRNNYYCAPNKLYEYAAAGVPAVGADLPPIRDFFDEFGTGETFDVEKPESLAASIRRLLDTPQRMEELRANGLAAVQVMCWEKESRRLLDLYERILADRPDYRDRA